MLALALWLLTALAAHAQAPANDDPCGAVNLPLQGSLCTTLTTGTNVDATTTVPNGYTVQGTPKDVWFKFTTAATGPASFGATITVNGNPAGLVQLFSAAGCAGPFTTIATSASSTPNTSAPRLVTGLLQASTTYYVRVSGAFASDQPGPFTICVSDGPGTAVCDPPTFGTFTSTSPTTGTITITNGVNTVPPYTVTIRNATAQNTFGTFTTSTRTLNLTGLTPGSQYETTISASCAFGTPVSTTYTFSVPITNDNPCGAVALPLNGNVCTPVAASTYGATPSGVGGSSSNCVGSGITYANDVWFTVQTEATGPGSTSLYLTVNGTAAKRVVLFSPSSGGCIGAFTPVACVINSGSAGVATPQLTATGLTPNTTYYVLVDGVGLFTSAPGGPFTICAASVPPCGSIVNTPSTTAVTATSARVLFSPPSTPPTPVNYTITYTPQGGQTATVSGVTSGYTLTGLTPGTTYSVCVASNCTGGGQSPPVCTSFTTTAACPAPTTLNVTGITTSTAVLSFNRPANGVDYVITLTPQGGGTPITITSATQPVTLTGLTPGTTYAVSIVANCGSGLTSAAATTTFTSAALCPAVSGLTVTPGANNTATVQFTGPPNATDYLLTYTPAGGSPVTVPVTTSPVVLNGLTPLVGYTVSVVTNCSGALTSAAATTSFALLPYCTNVAGSCFGPTISGVAIPGTTLSNLGTSCSTSTSNSAYSVYPDAGNTTATLRRGQTYQLALTPGVSAADLTAWIDYNQNGVFEAAEGFQVGFGTLAGSTATTSFTVPATAPLGRTGLRVRSRTNGSGNTPADACTTFGTGETEDYIITIGAVSATQPAALAAQVALYPNPAHHAFSVYLPALLGRTATEAVLYNALGQRVQQRTLEPTSAGVGAEFDVSGLSRGVYSLHLATTAGPITKRVVVE
ncbi:T9SS type A sorting domain-containing protein [Hymenobacter busanensis]|uniref:T9SS type A sorting domain-containing protein n=1 Tax=Hymenobacter busanensis TaxID=2607656 RepID=A0A7L4ZWE5_9BACT|nr:fibronectin type III domain-containing protein [Hymenobacter busanensis]KAA9325510.1 T9SS type A sorting domain-containing protein [Hymenobacter busanensis]QHJ07819.1 T9SS type A sorting domain-containing protein [Hymenobacter busanensis]